MFGLPRLGQLDRPYLATPAVRHASAVPAPLAPVEVRHRTGARSNFRGLSTGAPSYPIPLGGSNRLPSRSRLRFHWVSSSANPRPCVQTPVASTTTFPRGSSAPLLQDAQLVATLTDRKDTTSLLRLAGRLDMNEDRNESPHRVVIQELGQPSRTLESLPPISPGVTTALRGLLDAASYATEFWHTIPQYPLALRILPSTGSEPAIAFEIRAAEHRATVQRFRFEPGTRTLEASDRDSRVHPGIATPPDLPHDPHELGRRLTALVYHHPEIVRLIQSRSTPDQDPNRSSTGHDSNRPGPVSYAVTDFIRQLIGHWFTGHHIELGPRARFVIAFAGSLTFLIVGVAILATQFPEWIRRFARPTGPISQDLANLLPVGVSIAVIALIAAGLAALTSCINHQHGPVRIYLGGFLLPYFIATLLMWLYGGGTSGDDAGGTRP